MSFIQKLIERKTQATGSIASKHAFEEDLIAQEDSMMPEDGTSMVDIVVLDDSDISMQNENQTAEPLPEPTNNVLNLTDPFAIGDDNEITDDIIGLPDLEAEFEEEVEAMAESTDEVEQSIEPSVSLGDIDDTDDIGADDMTFNIWDIDEDDAELDTPAPDEIQTTNSPASEPYTPQARTVEPVNEILKSPMPLHTSEPTPEITPDATQEVAEPQRQEPTTPTSAAAVAPIIAPASPPPPAQPTPTAAAAPQQAEAPPPQAPENRRGGRVKTRLLGFEHVSKPKIDMFEYSANVESTAKPTAGKVVQPRFPVGWLVVIEGPGRGETFALQAGMSQIGRGEDQAVQLDFGDVAISRNNHAAIVYDFETHSFLMGHGGKVNVVRLNGKPLICTETLKNSDLIRIGETTLRLVVLCNSEFNWEEQNPKGADDVANA